MGKTRIDWMKQLDHLKWIAAGCALIATATAEHKLAVRIGMHDWVAACVPGALDAYVVRALRAHREVFASVLAMVGVNAASHLVTAGHVPVDWPLITAVSAIAPLVLWRVHALGTGVLGDKHASRKHWWQRACEHTEHGGDEHGESVRAPSVLAVDTPPIPAQVPRALGEHADPEQCPWCDESVSGGMTEHVKEHLASGITVRTDTFDEHADTAVSAVMPDYVPDSWRREQDESDACSACLGPVTYDKHAGWTHDDVSAACVLNEHAPSTTLKSVPDLPAGFVPADTEGVHADVLAVLGPGDFKYLGEARDADRRHRYEHSSPITLRALKTMCNVGTDRARRLLSAVRVEHDVQAQSTRGGEHDA